MARSLRDVLALRWLRTKKTHYKLDPKRAYYLSMEFLIGRSLASNVSNLLLDPAMLEACREKNVDWYELLDQEPDAGLGNGGLGRLAACFIESMATMDLPGDGLRLALRVRHFQTGHSRRLAKREAGQLASPARTLGSGSARPHRRSQAGLLVSDSRREFWFRWPASLRRCWESLLTARWSAMAARPSTRLRLWSAGAPDSFHFHQFSHGDFVGAVTETLAAESITRVLYPDDSTAIGQELRFLQEYFLCACSMHDIVRRFRANNTDWNLLPEKVAIQLNDTHPDRLDRGVDANPAGRRGARLGSGLGHHAAHVWLHQPHAASGGAGTVAGVVVRRYSSAATGDHLRDQPPVSGPGARRDIPATKAAWRG